jgi:hypothetical protein
MVVFTTQVIISGSLYHDLPFMESLSIGSHFLSFKREYIISNASIQVLLSIGIIECYPPDKPVDARI